MKLLSTFGMSLLFCCLANPVFSSEKESCDSNTLPEKDGPRTRTTGSVPHTQLDVTPNNELNEKFKQFAFSLPGVEKRPTIVSLPGAMGMWLASDIPVAFPKAIVAGREFAHIHTDGSLHAAFTYERAVELDKKGWGERHPWADRFDGWEGLVMLYSVNTEEELDVLMQLVTESYNHVTGLSVPTPGCESQSK